VTGMKSEEAVATAALSAVAKGVEVAVADATGDGGVGGVVVVAHIGGAVEV